MAILETLFCLLTRLFANHFFYLTPSQMIQSLLDLRSKQVGKSFYWKKAFLYVYYLVVLLRMLVYAHLLNSGTSLEDHLHLDTFNGALFLRLKLINRHTMPVIVLGCLFVIFIDYHFCFAMDTASLNLYHEISVENRRKFWSVNANVKKPRGTLQSLVEFSKVISNLVSGHATVQLNFARAQLSTLPNLSVKLRSRMVAVFTLLDCVSILANLVAAFGLILLLIFHLSIVVDRVGSISFTFAIFDALLFGYFVWSAIRFGIIGSFAVGGVSFVIRGHLRELNTFLGLAICRQAIFQAMGGHSNGALQRELAFFRSEHQCVLRKSETFNLYLVSRLMLALYLTNILFSVVTLNVLFRANVDIGEQVFLFLVIAFEGLLPLVACSIFVAWSSAFYRCDRLLFRAQACLGRSGNALTYPRTLLAKLQLLSTYELICTNKKFQFTVGEIGPISKQALYEFFFGYTSFFMYISKLMYRMHAYKKEVQLS